ncbi:40-residue YVTN family beta-propeller repeat protein [Nitrosococcus halophilus Nc 4]|uniref:40-residue YVTN family beta-propeller repeat protein n=1 Tax=Nitrosococcus halophilus (strain Nc4) TaxID=472759 RepID=D5BVY0_NITHN|nr:YncE family protein [Nitrosococcus halophilus]ADE15559.1 40-residue YVTN family beta-propeller repeat protein [Nitrosococcus halophilus Nc 4]
MKKTYGFLAALLMGGIWQIPSSEAGALDPENGSGALKLYVTLEGPDALGIVDPESKRRLGTILVGGKPHDVICAPDGSTAYITNPETNDLSIVDTLTDKVKKTVEFGEEATPWHVEISPDGSQVFAALQDQSAVSIIDTTQNRVASKVSTASGPWAIAAPRDDIVYATLNGSVSKGTANKARSEDIAVFDPTEASPTAKYLTLAADTANGPHGIVSAPDGSTVYIAAQASHEVWKISVDDNRVERVAKIPDPNPNGTPLNPGFPTDLAISPDGNTLIAVNHDLDSITVINLRTQKIIETVSTGEGSEPWGAIVAPDGQTVYVSTNGIDSLAFFPMSELTDGTEGANKDTIAGLPTSDGLAWCKLAQ